MAKIKNINEESTDPEVLNKNIMAIHSKFSNPIELRVLTADNTASRDILIKSEISVSSLVKFHDEELALAIETFKKYMEEIAAAAAGEISKADGFFHNANTFSRLY